MTALAIAMLIIVIVASIPVMEAVRDKEQRDERRSNSKCLAEYRDICDHRPHLLVDHEPELP